MQRLTLHLRPTDSSSYYQVSGEGTAVGEEESRCLLPFGGAPERRLTMLKALDAIRFRAIDFSEPGERTWLSGQGWLSQDGEAFSPGMRERIGEELYASLFPPGSATRDQLRSSRAVALQAREPLHLQIKIDAGAIKRDRLADYPWELLRDEDGFLAHHGVIFSRYLAYAAAPPSLPSSDQLNVLLVASGASDPANGMAPLPGEEADAIRAAIAQDGTKIRLTLLPSARFEELQTYLTVQRGPDAPHILHFDGHGFYGRYCNGTLPSGAPCKSVHSAGATRCDRCGTDLPAPQGYLLFEGPAGDPRYVSAQDLGTLLQQTTFRDASNRPHGIALAVLTACRSGLSLGEDSVFAGVAQSLIHHSVPAVVAMLFSVRVQSAADFTRLLYSSLAQRDPLVAAVSHGRAAMGTDGDQWYRPVLYLRWQDNDGGQLFSLATVVAESLTTLASVVEEGSAEALGPDETHELQDAVAAFQTDFEAAREQIGLLSYYKDLHDQLHTLQFTCYSPITLAAQSFPADALSKVLLEHYLPELCKIIAALNDSRSHAPADTIDVSWIDDLEQAGEELSAALVASDAMHLRYAINLMDGVLVNRPPQINHSLFTILHNLRLPRLEQAMREVHDGLAHTQLSPDTVREFGNGVAALGSLHPRLAALIEEHDMWQAIDVDLRTTQGVLDRDVQMLGLYWPKVKKRGEQLYGRSSASWATGLRADEEKLDGAVAVQDLVRARAYFLSFQSQAADRFYRLDKELKQQCDELRTVGAALSAVLRVIR